MDNKKSLFPIIILLPLFLCFLFSTNFEISATATPIANEVNKVPQNEEKARKEYRRTSSKRQTRRSDGGDRH
ncbi:hypothetical protein O6P43_016917 [Quillaja saponaria]|uniref:Transmembrane protein n=1 Tax=Quillaja saponaria TaxID=32244 RepID=A0AAD7PNT6_QUISA|nr:hypothetical protein O6P43_016917 [Quillaja saponaria]